MTNDANIRLEYLKPTGGKAEMLQDINLLARWLLEGDMNQTYFSPSGLRTYF